MLDKTLSLCLVAFLMTELMQLRQLVTSTPPCSMKSEVDVNVRSKIGRTPLHDAVTIGNVDIVEILLENGANPNCAARVDVLSSFDEMSDEMADMVDTIASTVVTPLERACYEKKPVMMKVRLELCTTSNTYTACDARCSN